MNSAMRVRAFAKINRSLRVIATRADGYHELRTIFQSIALHDTLTIRAARGPFRLTCDDPACPADDTNLIWRAAAHMWRAAGRRGAPRDVAIDLVKRIPMQAGLGGGSSDAAAALRALAKRWRVGESKMRAAAVALGADVPYFLEGGSVLGLDRGDLLFPLIDPPAAWVVLVLPDFGVSTKEAFGWFDKVVGGPKRSAPHLPAQTELVNDLEGPVVAHHPEIGRIISALRRQGASPAAMSGSGSAVFGLFSSRPVAILAAKRLVSASRRTLVTRTLNHQTYQRLAAT
ncbi:MAG TPA: 4-(cytidine 5'-diphospho)-2-C-methyl-D-erythritol kinase [Vicinamibacterales bacterium]|nr:4-(cytidine 5'-diphospho)-2-C-methyl-D-erythritol kinase [Vicinamibacterales bacterium]